MSTRDELAPELSRPPKYARLRGLRSRRTFQVVNLVWIAILLLTVTSQNLLEGVLNVFWFTIFGLLSGALLFFAMGWVGIIHIARQEVPHFLLPIRGKPAILMGAVMTLGCWGVSLWSLWRIVVFVFWPEQFGPI
jgi:hypothetical protein